jgi:hypothetical protein
VIEIWRCCWGVVGPLTPLCLCLYLPLPLPASRLGLLVFALLLRELFGCRFDHSLVDRVLVRWSRGPCSVACGSYPFDTWCGLTTASVPECDDTLMTTAVQAHLERIPEAGFDEKRIAILRNRRDDSVSSLCDLGWFLGWVPRGPSLV